MYDFDPRGSLANNHDLLEILETNHEVAFVVAEQGVGVAPGVEAVGLGPGAGFGKRDL